MVLQVSLPALRRFFGEGEFIPNLGVVMLAVQWAQ